MIPAGASGVVSTVGASPRPHGFPDTFDRARRRTARDVTGFGRFEAFFPPRSRTTAPA